MKVKFSKYNIWRECSDGLMVKNILSSAKVFIEKKELINQFKMLCSRDLVEDKVIDKRFIKKGFCLNEEINEVAYVLNMLNSMIYDKRVLRLTLIPTLNCNFSCQYCFDEHPKKHMNKKTIDKLIKALESYYKKTGFQHISISWFGGEPTLKMKLIRYFYEKLNEFINKYKNITHGANIVTNGYLLNKNNFMELINYGIKNFQITVDGCADTHNIYRPLNDGAGSWKSIWKNLCQMSSTDDKFKVGLRINYNMDVIEKLPKLLNLIKKNLDERFTPFFIPISDFGACDKKFFMVDSSTHSIILPYLVKELQKRNLSIDYHLDLLSPLSLSCISSFNNYYVVNYDGTLNKCTNILNNNTLRSDKFSEIGEINNGEFKVGHRINSQWVSRTDNKLVERNCKSCLYLPSCGGIRCPQTNFNKASSICPVGVASVINTYYQTSSKPSFNVAEGINEKDIDEIYDLL